MRLTAAAMLWTTLALVFGCGGDGGAGSGATGGGTGGGSAGKGGSHAGSGGALQGGTGGVSTGGQAGSSSGGSGGTGALGTGGVGALPGGWTELANTALDASGECAEKSFDDPGLAYGPTEGCSAVVRDWNGGIFDTLRGRLVFTGGGHTGYYGNELYAIELTGGNGKLSRLNDPTLPTNYAFPNPNEHTNCSDGSLFAALPLKDDGSTWGAPCDPSTQACAPNSRHNYYGLIYLSTTDQLFEYGGYLACDSGTAVSDTWLFDFASMKWKLTNAANPPSGGYARSFAADFDPSCGAKGCVILHDGNHLYRYDVEQNAYQNDAELPFGNGIGGAWDPGRKLFIMMGDDGSGQTLYLVDYNANPPAIGKFTPSTNPSLATCGPAIAASAQGVAYDPISKKTIFWPNQAGSVYALDPDAKSCDELAYPGGPPAAGHQNGVYGRFRYAPSPDAFIVVNDWNQNAFMLRIR